MCKRILRVHVRVHHRIQLAFFASLTLYAYLYRSKAMLRLQALVEELTANSSDSDTRNKLLADCYLRLGKWRREASDTLEEVRVHA